MLCFKPFEGQSAAGLFSGISAGLSLGILVYSKHLSTLTIFVSRSVKDFIKKFKVKVIVSAEVMLKFK